MPKIEELIKEYQPSEEARQLVIQTKIVLLVGISGVGKDTAKQRLMQSPEFADIVSYIGSGPGGRIPPPRLLDRRRPRHRQVHPGLLRPGLEPGRPHEGGGTGPQAVRDKIYSLTSF